MTKFEVKLPKMGESVAEATITSWLKSVGDTIEEDEAIVEIATDKVDSEVPSEVEGTITEILYNKNDIVKVGETIAVIDVVGGDTDEIEDKGIVEEITEEVKTIEHQVQELIEEPLKKNLNRENFILH